VTTGAVPLGVERIMAGRRARLRRRALVTTGLLLGVLVLFAASLMIGNTFYGPGPVLRVLAGQQVDGASYTVGQLRLPRATTGLLVGLAMGTAGVTFQTLLRNPLASPDVLGISTGASAAAVFGIITLGLDETAVSLLALGGALATALTLNVVAARGGFVGSRFILIGIGMAAMLQSIVAYLLSRAAAWDIQTAMRWLTGSLNGATWRAVAPLAAACAVLVTVLAARGRDLAVLRLGDDAAAALGVNVGRARLLSMLAAVVLLAFATAASGPVAFVAFMAGPIAVRMVGTGASLVLPAGLVGSAIVLAADLIAQHAFETRYPVGVITGLLGAPYLIALLIGTNRSGGSL